MQGVDQEQYRCFWAPALSACGMDGTHAAGGQPGQGAASFFRRDRWAPLRTETCHADGGDAATPSRTSVHGVAGVLVLQPWAGCSFRTALCVGESAAALRCTVPHLCSHCSWTAHALTCATANVHADRSPHNSDISLAWQSRLRQQLRVILAEQTCPLVLCGSLGCAPHDRALYHLCVGHTLQPPVPPPAPPAPELERVGAAYVYLRLPSTHAVPPVTRYTVECRVGGNAGLGFRVCRFTGSRPGALCRVHSLAGGTRYQFRLIAHNALGASAPGAPCAEVATAAAELLGVARTVGGGGPARAATAETAPLHGAREPEAPPTAPVPPSHLLCLCSAYSWPRHATRARDSFGEDSGGPTAVAPPCAPPLPFTYWSPLGCRTEDYMLFSGYALRCVSARVPEECEHRAQWVRAQASCSPAAAATAAPAHVADRSAPLCAGRASPRQAAPSAGTASPLSARSAPARPEHERDPTAAATLPALPPAWPPGLAQSCHLPLLAVFEAEVLALASTWQ